MSGASEWDEYAEGWDDDVAARAYAAAAFDTVGTLAGEHGLELSQARVVDFGCGTGLLTERLAPIVASVTAVDTSVAMLEVVRGKVERHGWSHVTCASDLRHEPGSCDLVVCSSVLSFVPDHSAMVHRLSKSLASGGVLVHWDWERNDADGEPHGLTREGIAAALTAAGLVDTSVETAFEVAVGDETMAPLMGSGRRP